jgi:predicted RNase H-like nuclease (RuvC/YqgF family)
VQFREVREKKSYTFRNEDATARAVLVEHPVRQGFELRSDVRPVETTAQWMRFRVAVAPKQTATLVVEEGRPLETTYAIGVIRPEMLDVFVKERSIDKPLEDTLRAVIAQKRVVSELEAQKAALDAEFQRIYDDQERLRENMKALKGSAEEKSLLQRYTKELDAQENRLESLRKETAAMEQKVAAAEAELEKMIAALSLDRAL